MSFVEFHQQADGNLMGLAAYEVDPAWDLDPISHSDGLIHPLVHSDEGTGTWIAFAPEQNLWGAVVRSQAAPFNDCLPPAETLFRESFRPGESLEEILENLKDLNNEAFANPFEALLVDREAGNLVRFHGSFQSESDTYPPGRYRLDDRQPFESFTDDEWWGFSKPPEKTPTLEEPTEHLSLDELEEHGSNDGIRTLGNVLVFQWTNETVQFRTATVQDSSLHWNDPQLVAP